MLVLINEVSSLQRHQIPGTIEHAKTSMTTLTELLNTRILGIRDPLVLTGRLAFFCRSWQGLVDAITTRPTFAFATSLSKNGWSIEYEMLTKDLTDLDSRIDSLRLR